MADLVPPKISCQTSLSFLRQLGLLVCCRTRWVNVVCRGFTTVVDDEFYMPIILSWIACVFIEDRFAYARMA